MILNTRIGPEEVSTRSQTSDVIIIAGDAHNAYKDLVSLLVNSGSAMKIRPAWLAMLRTTESHPLCKQLETQRSHQLEIIKAIRNPLQ